VPSGLCGKFYLVVAPGYAVNIREIIPQFFNIHYERDIMNKRHYTIIFVPLVLVPFFLLFLSISMVIAGSDNNTHEKSKHWKSKINPPEGMALIPGGKFTAGIDPDRAYEACAKHSDKCKRKWYRDQGPEHTVFVNTFLLDKYEVTQKDFKRVMGKNPSKFKGSNHPVEYVTWHEAKEYCEKSGKRLPTEAEWEKAARGSKNTIFPWGNEVDDSYAWYASNSGNQTHPVGLKKPTEYGLHDMAGNVSELVSDWYSRTYYANAPRKNPKGPSRGARKVKRGGSWHCSSVPGTNYPDDLQTAFRYKHDPTSRTSSTGFRCASSIPTESHKFPRVVRKIKEENQK